VENSDTRYAQSGDVHIAYRLFGAGPFDLVLAAGLDSPSVEFPEHAIGYGFDELTEQRDLNWDAPKRPSQLVKNLGHSLRRVGKREPTFRTWALVLIRRP
jgi:hypothetical protein